MPKEDWADWYEYWIANPEEKDFIGTCRREIVDMEKEVYLENPCKASSLPFWKTNLVKIPDNMKIVLDDDTQSIVSLYI